MGSVWKDYRRGILTEHVCGESEALISPVGSTLNFGGVLWRGPRLKEQDLEPAKR